MLQEPTSDPVQNSRHAPTRAPRRTKTGVARIVDPRYESYFQNGEPANASPPAGRSIFRAEARQHYIQNQEKVVLPPLVSRRIFVFLWILALLLMLAGSLIVFWPLIA